MAKDTPISLRNEVMYSVFVRNFSPEGNFEGVRRSLDRISTLGVDTIWLMPIHPVGEVSRKGSLGSPYAIRDYRAVNPEYGTLEDFRRLVDDIHAHGMRCIIDVVYNHTSPDSVLAHEHPEWFFRGSDGAPGRHVDDWSDIVDLDYGSSGALWDYQIDTLKYWAQFVDGFRCDVAPMVPLDFWLRARREVASVRPGCLWLAESVEPNFIAYNRGNGTPCLSDSELYQAFDLCYDYDVANSFIASVRDKSLLPAYTAALNAQEGTYPLNYVKLRFLENHDRPRAAFLVPDARSLASWTAFLYFQRGTALVYAGQERGAQHLPSLFDRDTVDWDGGVADLSALMRSLYDLKKDPIFAGGRYSVRSHPGGVLSAEYSLPGRRLFGVFPAVPLPALIETGLPDGQYPDLLTGRTVEVCFGMLSTSGGPVIVETA